MAMATKDTLRPPAAPPMHPDDYEEISLVDIARVLYRRRVIMAVVVALALLGGGALTFLAEPEFEVRGEVIALEHKEIISSWLSSRQAAAFAAQGLGGSLYEVLYPDDWDPATGAWRGSPPSVDEVAIKLGGHVRATSGRDADTIQLTVTMGDPQVARDVARAYVVSLDTLRPSRENLTRSVLFDEYYDGTNAQEAQRRAETAAAEKQYWLVFDMPTLPSEPVRPRPALNMALATVLGVMAAVLIAFALEWFDKYRAELKAPPR